MKKQNFETKMLENLERINTQISQLIKLQYKTINGSEYINVEELAILLGESKNTVYKRVNQHEIPFYKPGGKLLMFKVSEILNWISSTRSSTKEEKMQTI